MAPPAQGLGLSGVFITHAHIGHYVGLMMLGHEAAGGKHIAAFVMPRMADFLASNGPWSQLIKYENIYLAIMTPNEGEQIADDLTVTPFLVPHRQEFSEVVGFKIAGPNKSAIFLPDIDSWEEWDDAGVRIEDVIGQVDFALLDATFFADGEIPGRDMSGFPHPFVSRHHGAHEITRSGGKQKVRFIHMNHTNPLHDPNSPKRNLVRENGFEISDEGDRLCLSAP